MRNAYLRQRNRLNAQFPCPSEHGINRLQYPTCICKPIQQIKNCTIASHQCKKIRQKASSWTDNKTKSGPAITCYAAMTLWVTQETHIIGIQSERIPSGRIGCMEKKTEGRGASSIQQASILHYLHNLSRKIESSTSNLAITPSSPRFLLQDVKTRARQTGDAPQKRHRYVIAPVREGKRQRRERRADGGCIRTMRMRTHR